MQCSAKIYNSGGWGRFYPCKKKAVGDTVFCKIHNPEYIKAKTEAKEDKWRAEWKVKRAYIELQNTAVRACKEINPDNPLAVAKSLAKMYEALKVAHRELLHAQWEDGLDQIEAALALAEAHNET